MGVGLINFAISLAGAGAVIAVALLAPRAWRWFEHRYHPHPGE